MNHLTLPPFLLLLTSPQPTTVHCTTMQYPPAAFDHFRPVCIGQAKQSKSSPHTHTYPKTHAAQVHTMYTQLTHFFGLSLLYLQYLHTYLLLFFWFYLSSVVEVKGKRERLLFVKLLQSSLPLATTMSKHSKALLTLSLLARAPRRAIVCSRK